MASLKTNTHEGNLFRLFMADLPELYMFQSCPFCWKVKGLLGYLDLKHKQNQINPLKAKKVLPSSPEWTKAPVWKESDGELIVDSTPIMKHIDRRYNNGGLFSSENTKRRDQWIEWLDSKMSNATIPILYGSMLSAFKTTIRIAKMEKFGFFAKQLYAWAGFPIMWGIIARKRVKKDGRKPKQLWHDLLDEFTDAFGEFSFFGGKEPDLVDLIAFGYVSSISPYPQFKLISEHKKGMIWFNKMKTKCQV